MRKTPSKNTSNRRADIDPRSSSAMVGLKENKTEEQATKRIIVVEHRVWKHMSSSSLIHGDLLQLGFPLQPALQDVYQVLSFCLQPIKATLSLRATVRQSNMPLISGDLWICICIISAVKTAIPTFNVPVAIRSCRWFWFAMTSWSQVGFVIERSEAMI